MKATTEKIVMAYRIISNARLTKMENKEKFAVIRAMRELKPVATGYEDFIKDAALRLRPDGYEAVEAKQGKDLSDEERMTAERYKADVTECVKGELDREHDLPIPPLGEDSFGLLLESNDFTAGEMMILSEVFCN